MIQRLREEKFSLVLSGGGALGMSHLGLLSDLEKFLITPQEIVGTSMGGIIGACMAIGMCESEINKKINDFVHIYNWVSFSFSGNAIIDNKKIANIFTTIFQDKKMSDTVVPLKLITTNLLTGEKRVFTSEDDVYIKDAVLATMAIPGVFTEHIIDGDMLGDGFLCENLGINEATHNVVLAIDVLGENSFEHEIRGDSFFKTSNVLGMFERSMRLLIYNQTKTHVKNSQKEIYLLQPHTKGYKTFDFHKAKEIRALGLGLLEKSLKSS